VSALLRLAPEVDDALAAGKPVVALETTLVAHGFPRGRGAAVGRESERRVREAGAIPATVGVLDGTVRVGLDPSELDRFSEAGTQARKVGPRDLAAAAAQGALGATTVGGTLAACAAAGIRFLGTGGLGGVHRGWSEYPDVSPDLARLAGTEALVVSSGVKSLLDVGATFEVLEALGVPVLGLAADELPLFYSADGGPPPSARVESPDEAASIAAAHWALGGRGILVANPPAESLDLEPLVEAAIAAARAQGVSGQAVTPFVLSYLHEESGGRSLELNAQLVADNAAVAAEVAVAYARAT
jgi:pseudouridine-5'-phosphate glycosidase